MIEVRKNAHIQAAAQARRPTRWWVAAVVTVALILGSQIGGVAGLEAVFHPGDGSVAAQALEGLTGLLLILLVMLWVRAKEGRPALSVGFRGRRPARRFLVGLVVGAAMLTASTMLMWGAGGLGRIAHPTGVSTGTSALLAAILLGAAWIFQATSEEVAFRGLLFQWTGLQLSRWLAILVPSVLFAVLHLTAPDALASPAPAVNLVLYSMFAGVVVLADRGLWLVAGVHTGWNWTQGNVLGISVSGGVEDNTVVAFGPVQGKSTVLSGGEFGIEGTVGATLVLLAAILLVTWVLSRRQRRWAEEGPVVARGETAPAPG